MDLKYLKEKIFHDGKSLDVGFGRYTVDDTVVILLLHHGQIWSKATTCVPESGIDRNNQVLIKTWNENEGILEALRDSGIVEDTGKRVKTGYVEAFVCELLKKPKDFEDA
jgi:hypothetical protein